MVNYVLIGYPLGVGNSHGQRDLPSRDAYLRSHVTFPSVVVPDGSEVSPRLTAAFDRFNVHLS